MDVKAVNIHVTEVMIDLENHWSFQRSGYLWILVQKRRKDVNCWFVFVWLLKSSGQ